MRFALSNPKPFILSLLPESKTDVLRAFKTDPYLLGFFLAAIDYTEPSPSRGQKLCEEIFGQDAWSEFICTTKIDSPEYKEGFDKGIWCCEAKFNSEYLNEDCKDFERAHNAEIMAMMGADKVIHARACFSKHKSITYPIVREGYFRIYFKQSLHIVIKYYINRPESHQKTGT